MASRCSVLFPALPALVIPIINIQFIKLEYKRVRLPLSASQESNRPLHVEERGTASNTDSFRERLRKTKQPRGDEGHQLPGEKLMTQSFLLTDLLCDDRRDTEFSGSCLSSVK